MAKPKGGLLAAIEAVNFANMNNKESRAIREARNTLIEIALHAGHCYAGFSYLTASHLPAGELSGIIFDETEARNHQYPDDSRRVYYIQS